MHVPEHLLYAKSHEWVERLDDGTLRVGLTDYAQSSMGDLVYVDLPRPGDPLVAGESFAEVESVKAVSSVFAPVGGTVRAVNESLADAPEAINADPYGAWLVQVEDASGCEDLLTAADYRALLEREGA